MTSYYVLEECGEEEREGVALVQYFMFRFWFCGDNF